ncbi:MAG: nickel-dependent hydrogenase large subunit [Gammaproteobacteria bacterium]|nr:nickel-dependent hydrogenase large subunit [Gammaproteobacteria bacterium]
MGEGKRILGPFNRVEGDLEVTVECSDGRVSQAWVNSPLYRGYEQILQGKDPRDALVYTPRICGICSVSQSVAAARALAAAQGIEPTANGSLCTNLILAAENLADHLTHFYLFFMPDFAREQYAGRDWYDAVARRFRAQTGEVARQVLPARADFLHLTGILAGKWPHSLALQPGGSTRPIAAHERVKLANTIDDFREFLEQVLFDAALEEVTTINDQDALLTFCQSRASGDFAQFVRIAQDLELAGIGRAADAFLSYGAYTGNDSPLFRAGRWAGAELVFDAADISEDISHSWLDGQREPAHPWDGSTIPVDDEAAGYSWCKAPRIDGHVVEVGALARQVVDGQPLIRDLVARNGGNVFSRVVARLLELARVVPAMQSWVRQIEPSQSFCEHAAVPDEGQGAGLVEAARGSLGHWLRIRNGRILNYQIVAPTTWNFSPRDRDAVPGALEQALVGTEVGDSVEDSVAIQHVIRSFDPCMVCTVH